MTMKPILLAATACLALTSQSVISGNCPENDAPQTSPYPTAVVTDYVLGCMLANGVSPDSLRKCSCSMDFIASAIPYGDYEQVETLLRLQQTPGTGRSAVYKNSAWAKNAVADLREVQAESTLRCF